MTTGKHEFPKYSCHIRAARIVGVEPLSTPHLLLETDPKAFGPPEDVPTVQQAVTPEWLEKNKPQAGGYFVVYADGYTSYSPGKAFVDGYTLIEG